MPQHYTIEVKIELAGPLLTAGDEAASPGLDVAMARDRFGRYMLPFSLIKGKVRDALCELGNRNADIWLGSRNQDGEFEPERGRLRFSDFHTDQTGRSREGVIDRIMIDPQSGTAAGQKLMMMEAPFAYSESVTFTGRIEFVGSSREAATIENSLNEALRWVPAYGAYRTVGFGRTRSIHTSLAKSAQCSAGVPAVGTSLPLQLKPDRPLCMVGRKNAMNHFESLACISGSVLKGATSRLLLDISGASGNFVSAATSSEFPKLCEYFEVIRFAEARPMSVGSDRPLAAPHSVVTSRKLPGQYFDVALDTEPQLIHGAAPAFLPDWKHEDCRTVSTEFGSVPVERERRTRTAIDESIGRAKDKNLFSYGLVRPDHTATGSRQPLVWEGSIGLENVNEADRKCVAQELQTLFKYGLPNIGKTRATAAVSWLTSASPWSMAQMVLPDNLTAVTLQTECLMTDPVVLCDSEAGLETAYAEFWNEISAGSLRLVRFFARQSLYGGYVSRRARRRRDNGVPYEPYLLTDRGSVFVLQKTDVAEADELVATWAVGGLPAPKWVSRRYAADGQPLWRCCPYLKENGFGEIMVDLACHMQRRIP